MKAAYPTAMFLASKDLATKRPDIPWTLLLDGTNAADAVPSSLGVDLIAVPSLAIGQAEIVVFHRPSGFKFIFVCL